MTETIPPLLALAEGRKVRPRIEVIPIQKEITLHMTVAKLLRDHCLASWEWTHFPSGELRDKKTAGKLKQMGLKPGWPDFILLGPDDSLHCLELKRQSGSGSKLSDCQSEFCIRRVVRGSRYAVCRTLTDVLNIFEQWGCLRVTSLRKQVESSS